MKYFTSYLFFIYIYKSNSFFLNKNDFSFNYIRNYFLYIFLGAPKHILYSKYNVRIDLFKMVKFNGKMVKFNLELIKLFDL